MLVIAPYYLSLEAIKARMLPANSFDTNAFAYYELAFFVFDPVAAYSTTLLRLDFDLSAISIILFIIII